MKPPVLLSHKNVWKSLIRWNSQKFHFYYSIYTDVWSLKILNCRCASYAVFLRYGDNIYSDRILCKHFHCSFKLAHKEYDVFVDIEIHIYFIIFFTLNCNLSCHKKDCNQMLATCFDECCIVMTSKSTLTHTHNLGIIVIAYLKNFVKNRFGFIESAFIEMFESFFYKAKRNKTNNENDQWLNANYLKEVTC